MAEEDTAKEAVTSNAEDTKHTASIIIYFTNFLRFLLNFFLHFTLQK
jgi:hypothetical protein